MSDTITDLNVTNLSITNLSITDAGIAELCEQVRHLRLHLGRTRQRSESGQFLKTLGNSSDFNAIRPYQSGDSVKHIDWNASARTQQLQTRTYHAEKEDALLLYLDVSASMACSAQKWQTAQQMAIMLAAMALQSGIPVGLITSNPDAQIGFMPERQPHTLGKLANALLQLTPFGQFNPTMLPSTLMSSKRACYVMMISDFHFDPQRAQASLSLLAQKHQLCGLTLSERADHQLPKQGLLTLQDSETGQQWRIDCGCSTSRERYQQLRQQRQQHWAELWLELGAQAWQHAVGTPPVTTLSNMAAQLQ